MNHNSYHIPRIGQDFMKIYIHKLLLIRDLNQTYLDQTENISI